MQKSENNQTAIRVRRQVKQSTTLNRKYVRRPARQSDIAVPVRRSQKVSRFGTEDARPILSPKKADLDGVKIEKFSNHPVQNIANNRLRARQQAVVRPAQPRKLTAKELKDQAIKKALRAAEKQTPTLAQQAIDKTPKPKSKIKFGIGRVVLALSCAAAAIVAIAYFVNLNMPDISFRVAAMQTGIDASYPGYLPQGFSLSGITSENGKITLDFRNATSRQNFAIIEEKSHWDSNALLANFVKPAYGDAYAVVRDRGITIYIDGSNASWVNGGVVYKIEAASGTLTKKQITSIATSL